MLEKPTILKKLSKNDETYEDCSGLRFFDSKGLSQDKSSGFLNCKLKKECLFVRSSSHYNIRTSIFKKNQTKKLEREKPFDFKKIKNSWIQPKCGLDDKVKSDSNFFKFWFFKNCSRTERDFRRNEQIDARIQFIKPNIELRSGSQFKINGKV